MQRRGFSSINKKYRKYGGQNLDEVEIFSDFSYSPIPQCFVMKPPRVLKLPTVKEYILGCAMLKWQFDRPKMVEITGFRT